MYFKIEESLGNIKAVSTESFSTRGICIVFNDYAGKDPQILIYKNGIKRDICINGWTFPCIYNNIAYIDNRDGNRGDYFHVITFELLDPTGELQKVKHKRLYGINQSLTVETFFTLLYNISCCTDMKQFQLLYDLVIDGEFPIIDKDKRREKAINVLNFINSFVPQLETIKETDYLIGLKRKINAKFKEAQEIIASSTSPV